MKILKKINGIILLSVIIVISILIGYEFKGFRKSIKNIVNGLLGYKVSILVNFLYISCLKKVMQIFLCGICIFLFIECVVQLISKLIYKFKKPNIDEDDLFNLSLYNYIYAKEKRSFIISGEWGVGKTYKVREFVEKFLSNTNWKVYYVSCFGLDSRSDFLNYLKELYEKEDESFRTMIVQAVKVIPIIGDILYNLLKPKYEFKDMAKKSIFIFDDFERIVPIINNEENEQYYSYSEYRNSYYSNGHNNDNIKEYLEEQLRNIESGFYKIQQEQSREIRYRNLDKYNVLTGLINELVDIYEMKVIIICNSSMVDIKYYRDIFEGKLEFKKYNIEITKIDVQAIVNDNIERIVSLKKEKKKLLEEFFSKNNHDINKVWELTNLSNIRIFSGIVAAYINIVHDIDINLIKIYGKDIFYSIFIANVSYYNNFSTKLKNLTIGESLASYNKKYSDFFGDRNEKANGIFKCLKYVEGIESVKWCGTPIAFSWILGRVLSKSYIIDELNKINSYNSGIEEYIINTDMKLREILQICKSVQSFNIDDLLILLEGAKNENNIDIIEEIFSIEFIKFENLSKVYSISDKKMYEIIFLLMVEAKIEVYINQSEVLKNNIFRKIYDVYGDCNDSRLQSNEILELYKNWVNEGMNRD
ncbi:hypothetical protein [uncultured Clostridium sp.]|uniref:hypothetical protein n=1 Tax=uncultured Clostridium sp. TaxID=59620 RepID=UPI0025FF7856|nr:hypothetical protein [uncultured Clostridium sp.]MDU4882593.1 hypothetical protein [Clostridium celatum]MDU7076726.1 hypothetical protein [Clostridium celatum]